MNVNICYDYPVSRPYFPRNKGQQQLMRCFGNIEDYQLVLEHTDKSYRVVSGKFDDVVSANTTHWPGVAPTIHSSDSDDGIDDDEADSNYEEAEADSNDEEADSDSDETDNAKDDEDEDEYDIDE